MKLPKLTLRGKIMGTIALATALIVLFGGWKASKEIREADALGQYLRKHYNKYLVNSSELGTSEYALARLVSGDPALATALDGGDAAALSTALKRVADALQGTLAPELLLVSDAGGNPSIAPGTRRISETEWRSSRLFQDLREGKTVRGRFAVLGGKGYRVSAAPVRAGDRVVGAALIGEDLDEWFQDVAQKSGNEGDKQHRLSLVIEDREIASSAVPKSDWPLLLAAIKKPASTTSGSEKIPVLDMGDKGLYDFWSAPVRGYRGAQDPDGSAMGTFWLVRSRYEKEAKAQEAVQEILLVLAAGLGVALVLGYLLAGQITKPLRRYITATGGLSRGQADLSKRLEVETKDELGELASNLNRVFAKIHSLAAGVQRTAFQVNGSSAQIAGASRKTLDGAKEQAGKISGSTAAVTELSSSIQQVAENAAAATRTAKQSGAAVSDAIARLSQIRETVEDAAQRIAALGESGKRIGNIVEVIRQISEQTSMLALNAAIEAAHAGEHGRGFAVVADEVSSLAKRTGQSARDIEDLIATIRDQTSEAVSAMQSGTREVEQGTKLVEATLADLKTLVSVIDDTAAAVQEQAIASDEIARNMDAVQRIAQNVVGSSENAVTEGEKLQHLAEALEESVRGFRIDPARAAEDEIELGKLPEKSS
ncbi:MAG TPA: methyl-accepting chemotaxis protein [Polyangiaceae bacterium]|nr:methyl-accepting chemotaxis protein [Polyangiaceae bacterium]